MKRQNLTPNWLMLKSMACRFGSIIRNATTILDDMSRLDTFGSWHSWNLLIYLYMAGLTHSIPITFMCSVYVWFKELIVV
jgi:hypothetical protein